MLFYYLEPLCKIIYLMDLFPLHFTSLFVFFSVQCSIIVNSFDEMKMFYCLLSIALTLSGL